MEFTFKEKKTVEVVFLQVSAGVRYWEAATVNGIKDTNGDLIPFRVGDYWKPRISIEKGVIINWPEGTTADIHYKVCDDGIYTLLDEGGAKITAKDGYVPDIMCPNGKGYGDYIIMKIDENGKIANWKPLLSEFSSDQDD